MHIMKEIEFPRMVDGIAVLISQNIWSDGGVSYSLFDGSTGEMLSDEDFGAMPTDAEVRDILQNKKEQEKLPPIPDSLRARMREIVANRHAERE